MSAREEYATESRPVEKDEILPLAQEFMRHWSVRRLARVGLHQHVREILWGLVDTGDFLLLSVGELSALTDQLIETKVTERAFNPEARIGLDLRRAVKKVHFCLGRCFGLTNYDMGIKDD